MSHSRETYLVKLYLDRIARPARADDGCGRGGAPAEREEGRDATRPSRRRWRRLAAGLRRWLGRG